MSNKVAKNLSTASGSCDIQNIFMVNYRGDVKDIITMVKTVTLTESLYNPYVTLKLGIKDESNFFEFFEINGNEKIILNVRQKPFGEDEYESELIYRVTGYPKYSRGNSGDYQLYVIDAVSEVAYLSSLKNISRGFNGAISKEIEKIITNDLKQKIVVRGDPVTAYAGVIEWTKPLDQALEFTNTLYDNNLSPFFLWQNVHDLIQLRSYDSMIGDERNFYNTYYEKTFFSDGVPGNRSTDAENMLTIQNMNSFLGLNRVSAANAGAYASHNLSFDLSNRVYTDNVFNCFRVPNDRYLTGKSNYYPEFSPLGNKKSFSQSPDNVRNFSYRNSLAFGGLKNSGDAEKLSAPVLDSYTANMDTLTHEITVSGDLFLNPGKIVALEVPKATDLKALKNYVGDDAEVNDLVFSRKYLVTTSIHTINLNTGNYTTTSKIVTDSVRVI